MSDDDVLAGGRPAWRPAMPRAEAARWVLGSIYRPSVFHATSREAAEAIRREGFDLRRRTFGRIWGIGVYATPERTVAEAYRAAVSGGDPVIVELAIRVRRILAVEAQPGDKRPDFLNRILDSMEDGRNRWFHEMVNQRLRGETEAAAVALRLAVQAAGYDALEVRELEMSAEIGGTQLVIYEPSNVVVIEDDEHSHG